MERRLLLKGILAASALAYVDSNSWRRSGFQLTDINVLPNEVALEEAIQATASEGVHDPEGRIGNDLDKVRFFENDFNSDIYLAENEQQLLHSSLLRMSRTQQVVGHGNFNLLGFDELIQTARNYSAVGAFTAAEKDFIEKIFSSKASGYGFLGGKVVDQLTFNIKRSGTYKVPHSGHYLFKDQSLSYYKKLQSDVGSNIVLTSGIRSNIKQLHLFLAKCARSNYNLSKASRSLAPPGYSYHGIGDFDVGRVGMGANNFTDEFAQTDEFKRMLDLGYVKIRYTKDNRIGVRFEPWHIKVV